MYLTRERHAHNKYYAMKVLKKVEVVRLKQVEPINSEKDILSQVKNPFIVNLYAPVWGPAPSPASRLR